MLHSEDKLNTIRNYRSVVATDASMNGKLFVMHRILIASTNRKKVKGGAQSKKKQ